MTSVEKEKPLTWFVIVDLLYCLLVAAGWLEV